MDVKLLLLWANYEEERPRGQGPGTTYQRCVTPKLVICAYSSKLSSSKVEVVVGCGLDMMVLAGGVTNGLIVRHRQSYSAERIRGPCAEQVAVYQWRLRGRYVGFEMGGVETYDQSLGDLRQEEAVLLCSSKVCSVLCAALVNKSWLNDTLKTAGLLLVRLPRGFWTGSSHKFPSTPAADLPR